MTIDRLKELRRAIDTAIACEGGMMIDMTIEESNQWFRRAGAVPGVHHLIIGQFAITDLNAQEREKALMTEIAKLRSDNQMLMGQLAAKICPAE